MVDNNDTMRIVVNRKKSVTELSETLVVDDIFNLPTRAATHPCNSNVVRKMRYVTDYINYISM